MFRATMCPSSGGTTVSMRHFVFVTLCGWLSGMQGGTSTMHTRQSSVQNNKYQVSHKYSCFSWWCARSRPKHVEKRNKHTEKTRFLWRCGPTRAMVSSFTRFLDHTQPPITVGRNPPDEWSSRRRDFYLTTQHSTTDRHPCPRRDSNPQSQQASGHRPTP